MNRFFSLGVAAAVAAVLAAPASAHHAANAQFDLTRTITVQGTLEEVENVNPHSYWHFTVNGQRWAFEGASPAGLKRLGLKPKADLVKGAKYTVIAAPARNKPNLGLLQGLTLPDGRKIMMRLTPAEAGK